MLFTCLYLLGQDMSNERLQKYKYNSNFGIKSYARQL